MVGRKWNKELQPEIFAWDYESANNTVGFLPDWGPMDDVSITIGVGERDHKTDLGWQVLIVCKRWVGEGNELKIIGVQLNVMQTAGGIPILPCEMFI